MAPLVDVGLLALARQCLTAIGAGQQPTIFSLVLGVFLLNPCRLDLFHLLELCGGNQRLVCAFVEFATDKQLANVERVSEQYRPLVASGLIETLKKQWPDAWGARMEHLLRHAVLALLEQSKADLHDLMRLFVYKGYRRQITEALNDPQVRSFWKHEFPALNYQTSADGVSPIANNLGAILAQS